MGPKKNVLGSMSPEHERVLREVPPVVHKLETQNASLWHGFGQLNTLVGTWGDTLKACRTEMVNAAQAMGTIPPMFTEL